MTRAWRTDPVQMGATEGPGTEAAPDRAIRARKPSVTRSGLLRLGASVARAGRAAWSGSFRRGPGRFEEALHALAADLSATSDAGAIEAALLRFAAWVAPRGRAEVRRGASDGPGENGGGVEVFPVRCGGSVHGELRVDLGGAPACRGLRRRLSVGCALAGSALEGARSRVGHVEVEDDDWSGRPVHRGSEVVRDATFLNAVLPFALGQARRHGEPLALLCVKLDRLGAIRDILGAPTADRLVHELAEVVGSIVRTSDIVARLEDDRIVALLVRSRAEGARKVARAIVRAVGESGLGAPYLPGVSVSVGSAGFPEVAGDASALLEAADEAMAAARAEGGNRIVEACPRADRAPDGPGDFRAAAAPARAAAAAFAS